MPREGPNCLSRPPVTTPSGHWARVGKSTRLSPGPPPQGPDSEAGGSTGDTHVPRRFLTLKMEEPKQLSSKASSPDGESAPLRGVVPVCDRGMRTPNPQHQKWDLEHYSLKCDSTKRLWT